MENVFISSLFSAVNILTALCASAEMERFIVVSDYDIAWNFYPRVRNSKSNRIQSNISLDAKKQICEDITSGHIFSRNKECPYSKRPNLQSRLFNRSVDYYPMRVVLVYHSGANEPLEEHVIVCQTQKSKKVKEYYISTEYNLLGKQPKSDRHTKDKYISGRFIFHKSPTSKKIELYGMAEVPAKTFTTIDYPIEYLYQIRRKIFQTSRKNTEDPLCKLRLKEKSRICAAVFNSKYFEGKASFPRNATLVHGDCEVHSVSYQTGHGERNALRLWTSFRERMLNCYHDKSDDKFTYFISHAYLPNVIFVYVWDKDTGNVYPETLCINIRIPVERIRYHFQGDKDKILEDGREEMLQKYANSRCITM